MSSLILFWPIMTHPRFDLNILKNIYEIILNTKKSYIRLRLFENQWTIFMLVTKRKKPPDNQTISKSFSAWSDNKLNVENMQIGWMNGCSNNIGIFSISNAVQIERRRRRESVWRSLVNIRQNVPHNLTIMATPTFCLAALTGFFWLERCPAPP